MKRLFLGVDPGIRNIGLYCITEEGQCLAQGTFGHDTVKCDPVGFYNDSYTFYSFTKSVLVNHFFPVIEGRMGTAVDIFCVIEKQFKSPYIEVAGLLATLLTEAGIRVVTEHCTVARKALGIPCDTKSSDTLKKRVHQYYTHVTQETAKDTHCADAFVNACYARYQLTGTVPVCKLTASQWFSRAKVKVEPAKKRKAKAKPKAKAKAKKKKK